MIGNKALKGNGFFMKSIREITIDFTLNVELTDFLHVALPLFPCSELQTTKQLCSQ